MEVHCRNSLYQILFRQRQKERNIPYVVFRSSYSQFLSSDLIVKEKYGEVLVRFSLQMPQTAPLTLWGWTVACLTALLSQQSNIHNWSNNMGEGIREQLAVESADGHRPWLLSECEMPKPDCTPEPGGQRRSRHALTNKEVIKNNLTGRLHPKTSSGSRWPLVKACYFVLRSNNVLSCAEIKNCFSDILKGFYHGM